MKNLKNFLAGFLVAIIAVFTLSSFGSVPSATESRVADSREESAAAKRENKKQARLEQRRERLEQRMEKAASPQQKARIQHKLDRSDKVKKAEVLGTLALAFGASGLGIAVVLLVLMWIPFAVFNPFWILWSLAFMLALAGMIIGIIGKNLNDNPIKAKIGMIFGIVALALLIIMLLLFFIVLIALLASI